VVILYIVERFKHNPFFVTDHEIIYLIGISCNSIKECYTVSRLDNIATPIIKKRLII